MGDTEQKPGEKEDGWEQFMNKDSDEDGLKKSDKSTTKMKQKELRSNKTPKKTIIKHNKRNSTVPDDRTIHKLYNLRK